MGDAAGQDGKASSDLDFTTTFGSSNPTAISGVSRDEGCAGSQAVDHWCSRMGGLEARKVGGDQGATTKDERKKQQQGKTSSQLPCTQHSAWLVMGYSVSRAWESR